jgi:hypothetical protein
MDSGNPFLEVLLLMDSGNPFLEIPISKQSQPTVFPPGMKLRGDKS